ncbi:class I SAM-dependent methyltransferase, partial [Prochlorococcus sp. AH-716-E17]|nr:class I SAM-dependent methyltransferase [Prochlorococcus sp. AH-716-E17]
KEFPKAKAANLAKKYDFDYWDGDRRINYGGYKYIPGRWEGVAKDIIDFYKINSDSKILDIGCGKGFLLYEFKKLLPKSQVFGIDISKYAIDNAKQEIKDNLILGSSKKLPWENNYFDLVISINTFHNLYCYELEQSLLEMERVGKKNKYICVESYRNEIEKTNLLYWQVTCEAFNTPEEWKWWFNQTKYTGHYSFIYFE